MGIKHSEKSKRLIYLKIPSSWKHVIIIHAGKPGKDKSNPSNYRPITLTSNLCKLLKTIIIHRLNYLLEIKGLISSYQSRFRAGRNTMDAVLSIEADIRKAQANIEVLIVLFDIEKVYDMLWKEGHLIKLNVWELEERYKTGLWISFFKEQHKLWSRVL